MATFNSESPMCTSVTSEAINLNALLQDIDQLSAQRQDEQNNKHTLH